MKLANLPIIGCLFNGIPGPWLAKFSRLWMAYHLLRGNYRAAVQNLHRRYGPIVQVAPQHYSLSGKEHVYIPKLIPSSYPADTATYHNLNRVLNMESLLMREPAIDECNRHFIALLPNRASLENVHQIRPLLTRYAWEVLLMMTTHQRAGFLNRDADNKKTEAVLKNWKFHSIIHLTYLSYYPYIDRIWKSCIGTNHSLKRNDIEAHIALCLAAADPAITLIFTALQHVFNGNENLLQQLHEEITRSEIDYHASFKSLLHLKPQLPLLYGLLQECARLTPPGLIGPNFTTPDKGINAAGHQLPPGHLISIEQATAHINETHFGDNATVWNVEKWLDRRLVAKMNRQLLAFNITDRNNIEHFQMLLAAKLLVQIIRSETLPGPRVCSSEDSGVPATLEHNQTRITFTAANTLTIWLRQADAEALLTGRLAPHHKNLHNEEPIYTEPIQENYVRALIHDAIKVTHGARLDHLTHPETKIICIGPRAKIPRDYYWRKQRDQRQRHVYQQHRTVRGPPSSFTTGRTTEPQTNNPRTTNWCNWAEKEGERQDYLRTDEGYRKQQEQIRQREEVQKQINAAEPPQSRFKETFKRTDTDTVNGKLGGIRKVISTEVSTEAGDETKVN